MFESHIAHHAHELHLSRIHVIVLSQCAMSKPFSWCNNKSWPYTHDSLSLHRRHCALVSIISHCIWVSFIVASSSCLIQVYLGATIDHRAYDSSSCLIAQVILPLCHIWEGETVSHPILLWLHVAHHYISWSPSVGANNACPCMCFTHVYGLTSKPLVVTTPIPPSTTPPPPSPPKEHLSHLESF